MRRIYYRLVNDDARRFIYYKVTHRREYADIRTAVHHYERGRFSLAPFDRFHCIFVHITKTAGTSVATSLFGDLPGHYTASDYRVFFGRRDFGRYFKFAFVRNPWDRLLSAFTYLKGGGWNSADRAWAEQHLSRIPSFEHFVRDWLREENLQLHAHFKPQFEFVTDHAGRMMIDYLGYMETLADDFAFVAKRLGVETTLAHTNRSERSDYRGIYTPAMKEAVARAYRRDVDLFGYDFDGIRKRTVIPPK